MSKNSKKNNWELFKEFCRELGLKMFKPESITAFAEADIFMVSDGDDIALDDIVWCDKLDAYIRLEDMQDSYMDDDISDITFYELVN